MFTVGNGDFKPADGLWQLVSSAVAATGIILVTLSVTYLLSVLSAVAAKRAFASQIHGLGGSADEFVLSGWNGRDLHGLDRQLNDLSSQLSRLTEQYLAYPVLQYYHAAGVRKSPVKAVAILDDALTLMSLGVDEAARPNGADLTSARSAVTSFMDDTLEAAAIAPAPDPPPHPRLQTLAGRGIPTVDEARYLQQTTALDDRRRTLLGLVHGDGWNWSD